MKKKKEDFYIAMLRFGAANLENGFRLDELIKHLKGIGFLVPSENATLLHHYFPQAFFSKHEMPYPDLISFFYIRQEAYFHLLDYDSMVESKKNAKSAMYIAIIAIFLTFISILVSIYLS